MRIWLICHLVLVCWASVARADLSKLEYVTEEAPPYSFSDRQGQPSGLAVELLQLIWKQSDLPPQRVRVLPWARGYYMLTQRPNIVLFPTARTPAREALFKWVCTIDDQQYILLGRKEQDLKLTSFDQLRQYKISAVRSDAAELLLLNNGMDYRHLLPTNRLAQGLKMLEAGRADLLATNKLAGYEAIRDLKLNRADFNVAMVLSAEPLCYAFNLQVADSDIARFQQAFNQVRVSEAYRQLQTKYLP